MTTLNQAVKIESPVASISHLLPFEQKQHIERLYYPKLQRAYEKMSKSDAEYKDTIESRSVLIQQKASEYLANPSERHGFIVKQVYPTNQQAVIQSMAREGYMVHRAGMGLIYFISTKKNALKDATDKATAEAEMSIDKMIERLKVKASEAVHQRNKVVIEARKALGSIKPFESYLNVIVTDPKEVSE